ncbi:oxidoreductase-like domain-containing protein [Aspergillus undulatus]|uniref:oxidoreductase-like domain-containing protein n=1 Tax=Aspergillus undulatus TaxID=1810928 RepID=UPI003CCD24F2
MESHALVAIRHSLSRSFTSSSISTVRTSLAQNIRRHRCMPPPRRLSHNHAKPDPKSADTSQAYPLTGYYSDILSARSSHLGQATTAPSAPEQKPEAPPAVASQQPQSPEERMAIVFGTRLAGPGRSSRYHPGSNSAWKTVNGVPIPPRPEEPDNCCMSGCVHCVWDDYRDEMEEWAAVLAQAKAKGESLKSPKVIPGAIPKTPESGVDSTSLDDDGGGSETNWSVPGAGAGDDLFADIPVGIREFMKTEKKLKEMHRQEGTA